MQFYSLYKAMTGDARKIPDGVNVKLIIRHSIREENPSDGNYESLMLTKEGIALAGKIGASLDRTIGIRASSKTARCIQTITCMTKEIRPQYCKDMTDIQVLPALSGCLGDPQPKVKGGVGWYDYFHYLQEGDVEKTRGITLDQEAKRLIDCVFSNGGRTGALDILCTHDCCVVILASALFGLKTDVQGSSWCGYAEGMFLSGTREKFTAWWRGEQREFLLFLL